MHGDDRRAQPLARAVRPPSHVFLLQLKRTPSPRYFRGRHPWPGYGDCEGPGAGSCPDGVGVGTADGAVPEGTGIGVRSEHTLAWPARGRRPGRPVVPCF